MDTSRLWSRPKSLAYPTVWRKFVGPKMFPNGKFPKFKIQDLTEDLLEDVLIHMTAYYMEDEPLCKSINYKSDPLAVKELQEVWREFSQYKMALVCLLENKEELGDDTLPTVVGCNMTGVLVNGYPPVQLIPKSPLSQKVFDLLEFIHKQVDIFQHFGISECLYALGLSVHPSFRGHGLGLEIMNARFQLGKAVGLKATVTVFTNITSQTIAKKVGMETLYEIPYEDYKVDNEIVFNNSVTKTVKLMGKKIE